MTIGLVLLVVLVVLAVLFVLIPLLRGSEPEEWKTSSAAQVHLVELRERRDAALSALRELELDHETGKLDEHDYEAANAELRAEALAALAALDDEIRAARPDEPVDPPPTIEHAGTEPTDAVRSAADSRAES
ncbi:MAG: c-type cytochrome biogenesis protein CcmI [Gaiellales bacterium]